MKKRLIFVLTLVMVITSLLSGSVVYACKKPLKVSPIVTVDWLEANSNLKNLVILDIRSSADYASGHIKNSINVPFEVPLSAWITMRDDLLLELPEKNELFGTIGACGITKKSIVVIVTAAPGPSVPPYSLAGATRVADTLIYAGIKNVAILDGGYTKWVSDNKQVTLEVPVAKEKPYYSSTKNRMFVSREYVENHIGKSVIIDTRDADVYSGAVIEPYADKPGHIESARSLPAPIMWNQDGTFKSIEELKEMAADVVERNDKAIVYCGVGGYASSWWFILTQVLGYENVKFYDGSAQEWAMYNDMVLN